jgi:Carboxypeptidase regulatory-like domain
MSLRRNARGGPLGAAGLALLSLSLLLCGLPPGAAAQSPQLETTDTVTTSAPDSGGVDVSAELRPQDQNASGYISGTVVDKAGAVAVGARVHLKFPDRPGTEMDVVSGENGQFSFSGVPPGAFQLTISAEGFETQLVPGTLEPGQLRIMPVIRLAVATVVTEVRVAMTQVEVAQEQIKEQEKQRVFGLIPNFFVSYAPDPVPLTSKQKFELAWKSTIDPFTFVGVAAIAGVQQATDDFSGYGQGWDAYAKRFGAGYADVVSGTFIGSAILPSLLKQDPRYFYKSSGSFRSRLLYALGNTVICKGDNMRWQPNYSGLLGSFATGGISYFYYPTNDRDLTTLVLQNSLIRIGETAFANVMQQFVVRRLTPRLQTHPAAQP